MATEITMPKLSDTMTEGKLISWKKSPGDRVERGEILAEVETDKANMELESFTSGVLLETRAKAGDVVPVGTVIGVIGEAGEKVAPASGAARQEATEAGAAVSPRREAPTVEKEEAVPPAGAGEMPGPDLDLSEERPEAALQQLPAGESEKASPLVRRLAREHGIDLRQLTGSGPGGRITRDDLERLIRQPEEKAAREEAVLPAAGPAPGNSVPLSRMRAAVARTVSESWRTIPHFTITVRIDVGEAEVFYRGLKESGKRLSINDLVVKAAALALAKFPMMNGTFSEHEVVTHEEINIGIAVSVPNGLLLPVIKGCQRLSLLEIARQSHELAERAREDRIKEAEISGGTFSISNLGMYGVDQFMAVIFPPQGAILAVGAVADDAGVKNGQVVPQRAMKVTLSADHRLVDGAYAAQFLGEFRRILENPVKMMV